MKLWSFVFPDSSARLRSARVAANERSMAATLLAVILDEPVDAAICQYAGEIEGEERVVETSERSAASP